MGVARKIVKKIKNSLVVKKKEAVRIPIYHGSLLEGHTALIVGGTGGIGQSIAERFISNGCKVIITGTNEEKLKMVCAYSDNKMHYVVVNLNQVDSFPDTINDVEQKVGKIDIFVNAAGLHGPSSMWDVTENDWDSVMDVNVKGMYFMCQAAGKYMKEKGIEGHILNVSSASALKPGKTPYEISKNAVRSMTLGLADEMIKYGIVVNCIAPGPTATKMLNYQEGGSLSWPGNPTGRMAAPEEIANWAVLMVSDLGNYVIGDSFYITGGSGTICIDK